MIFLQLRKTLSKQYILKFVLIFLCSSFAIQHSAFANTEAKTQGKRITNSTAVSAKKTIVQNKKINQNKKAVVAKKSPAAKPTKSSLSVSAGSARNNKKYFVPTRPSVGMLSGLHTTTDPLDLRSSVAMVIDADSGAVLYEKNAHTPLPIASISKLMTALVVLDRQQDLTEQLMIDNDDVNLEKFSRSRLKPGTILTRYEALSLALMASENRAANVLSRYFPGGKPAFVQAMNNKAKLIGMTQTNFNEGTGLSSANVASAQDLVKLVQATLQYPLIRELSTRPAFSVNAGQKRPVDFHTTNRLISNPNWDIQLQKTGFISEAGQCLVMAANIEGRSTIMVFLDSQGKLSRLGDAQRVRDWLSEKNASVQKNMTASVNLNSYTSASATAQHTDIISPKN